MTWPDRRRWHAYVRFTVLFNLFFFPIYVAGGHLASGRTVSLFLPWEPSLPLVPWMVWPYLSLYSTFLLPLFHMTPGQIAALSRQVFLSLLAAGATFVLLPTRLGFPRDPVAGPHGPLLDLIHAVDTPHNLVPSLHVTFAALLLLGSARRAPPLLAWTYRLWLVVMSAATVLVHQHHLLDVAAGLGLAWAAGRLFPRISRPASAAAASRRQSRA